MELGFQHLASHRCSFTLFKFPVLQRIFSQLTTEDFLTADELGWFPGSLVLGQVLGILLGPLLADLVNSLKWPSANNPKLVCILYIKCVYHVHVGGQKNHLPACGSHLLCLLAPSLNQVLLLTLLLLLLQLLLMFLVSLSPGFMGLLLLLLLFSSSPGFIGLLLQFFFISMKVSSLVFIVFSTSQLGWTLLLARTLTGLTDSLVTLWQWQLWM